jgi:septal ring factor EnvC (AmiA/AmiB activator)
MRKMADQSGVLERAGKRLSSALDVLEAAVNRRREQDRQRGELEAQVQAFGTDRSRLAGELDHARASISSLEATNREVAQRLDQAVDTIRAVLHAQER